jgi:hypothetical protein
MSATEILISLVGALSGWTLIEVVSIGKKVARLEAQISKGE